MTNTEALAGAWRSFIKTQAGQEGMKRLSDLYAGILVDVTKQKDPSTTFAVAQRAAGFKECIDEINRIQILDKSKKGGKRR